MIVHAEITGLDEALMAQFVEIKQIAQGAMAEKFLKITRENFGDTGVDRPAEWAGLSTKYAKKIKRDHATLYVTGELEQSIQFENGNPEYSEVFTENEYAMVHQIGGGNNIPPRPFMPVVGNPDDPQARLTDFAEAEIFQAAQEAIDKIIK